MTHAITPENVVFHTLIGLETAVVDSSNADMIGIAGTVVDETRNTLIVNSQSSSYSGDCELGTRFSDKIVPKSHTTFIFGLPDGSRTKIDGGLLVARPEDRIAKKLRSNR
jgi:ribonuclease P protein subunit POP4